MNEKLKRRSRALYHTMTSSLRLLPDFIIIGTQRGGTTSLYNYLRAHPAFFLPNSRKELHFFDNNYYRGPGWYRAPMPLAMHKAFVERIQKRTFITGEATPYYLFHPAVPQRVASLLSQVRLIVLLRNPIDRAYSHYQFALAKGVKELPFEEAIKQEETRTKGEEAKLLADEQYHSFSHQYQTYLQRGIYADQLARWFDYFPREQFLILQSEDLYTQPARTFDQVLAFLNVPVDQYQEVDIPFKRYNSADYDTDMTLELRKQLIEYFTPHNDRLYQLLGRSFSWEQIAHT